MGNSNSNDEPKEEIDIDTTNVGLWNMNNSEVSTIGARELLTIVVLVMVMVIIINGGMLYLLTVCLRLQARGKYNTQVSRPCLILAVNGKLVNRFWGKRGDLNRGIGNDGCEYGDG